MNLNNNTSQSMEDPMKQNIDSDKMVPSSAAIDYLNTFNLSFGDINFGSEMAGLEYGFLGDMVQTQLDPTLLGWGSATTSTSAATVATTSNALTNTVSESILSETNLFPSTSTTTTNTSVFPTFNHSNQHQHHHPNNNNNNNNNPNIVTTSSSTPTFNNNGMIGSTLSTPLVTQHQQYHSQQLQQQLQLQQQQQQSLTTPTPQKQRRRSYQSFSSTTTDATNTTTTSITNQLTSTKLNPSNQQKYQQQQQQSPSQDSMTIKPVASPASSSTSSSVTIKKVYSKEDKPFNYAEGFHYLIKYVKEKMEKEDLMRISMALAKFRPSFLSLIHSLTEDDLIFMEKCIQRTLLEYEKLISFSGTPTAVWRRTGEICLLGKEFCLLTQWTKELLLSKTTYIYELMDCGSAVEYWEQFSQHAFDNTEASCHYTCILRTPQKKSIACTFCFMIKRDIFDLPSVIIGNFLPILS
ncbi:unnamed protein product [Cunninghamella blakesleeana]